MSTGKVRGLYCTEYDIHDLKLTEQALAAREEQLRLFTDNIPEPVVYLDGDRRYEFVNEAFLRLYGLDREEVIGKRPEEVLGAENSLALLAGPRARAVQARRSPTSARWSTRWAASAGSARVACPTSTSTARSRASTSSATTSRDLKEAQDALAARESQLRAIMDGVPAPVAYIDRDEHCHYVNRTFLQYFGLAPEQVAELRLRDVVGHGIYQSAQAMLDARAARANRPRSTGWCRARTACDAG